MIKRKPGFMGLAEQNARKKMTPERLQFLKQLGQQNTADQAQEVGMQDKIAAFNHLQQAKESVVEVPKNYYPPNGGPIETLGYINQQEAEDLRRGGASGDMTEYGVESFARGRDARTEGGGQRYRKTGVRTRGGYAEGSGASHGRSGSSEGAIQSSANIRRNSVSGSGASAVTVPTGRDAYTGSGGGGSKYRTGSKHGDAVAARGGGDDDGDRRRRQAEQQRIAEERRAAQEARAAAEEKRKQERHEQDQKWAAQRQGYVDEYGGYKGEAAGLGTEAKDITGQFGQDATKLGAYQSQFDTMAGEAKTRGDTAATAYSDEAGKGQTAMADVGAGYKGITGQGMVDAAATGQAGFEKGAGEVAGVQERFGEEGFEKDVGGYES